MRRGDDRSRGAITVLLNRAAFLGAVLGGIGTMGLMAIICADVIGRGAFAAPFPATAEIVAASIVAIVFLQLPEATASGRMIRSDMVLGRVTARSPRAGAVMDAVHHAIGTLVMAVMLRYVGPEILEAIEDGETVGLYGILLIPRWPFLACVLAGLLLTLLQFARLTFASTALAIHGETR